MQHLQESKLAWLLIDEARAQLGIRERNHVFVSVGAGDSFTAIRILLKLIAVKQIPLSLRLTQLCSEWLEAYVMHEDYVRLQSIVGGLTVTSTELRPGSIVKSLTCKRNSAASATAVNAYRDRGAVARAD